MTTDSPRVHLFVTHPIQYQIPWFRELAKSCQLKVFFSHLPNSQEQAVGFGKAFSWDIPLLEGYAYEVLNLPRFANRFFLPLGKAHSFSLPDVVILNGWAHWSDHQLFHFFRQKKIPVIVRGESNSLQPRNLFQKSVHRSWMRKYNAYLAIGKSNRNFYQGYGVSPERIFDARYFVENPRIRKQYEKELPLRDELRQKWAIPRNAFCFLFSGKLEPKKRILDILEAMKKLKDLGNSIHLLVMGDGVLMPAARAFVAEQHLPVTFTGFLNQTEITRAYAAADCLVLPSNFGETWGLVVNEAMVCGLPVIVSDRVGCCSDLIFEGETGLVFPFSDTNCLAEKMKWMAENRESAKKMGEKANQLIQNYSVENTVSATMKAVQFVLKSQS